MISQMECETELEANEDEKKTKKESKTEQIIEIYNKKKF
jgi:hypothetical protein